MSKASSGVLKIIIEYKVLNIAVCINKYWGFSLLLLDIMDSNRREYNLVCKQQAIPENIHATFTQSTSSSQALSRWSAPFVPESWLWYGVVAINNLDKTCHNLLRGPPEALKSISIAFISTNSYIVELSRGNIKRLVGAVLSAAWRGCFECKPVDEFHLVTRYI